MVFHGLPFPPLYLPHYLIPPSPFRRRTSSTDTTGSNCTISSSSSAASAENQSYLTGHTSVIRCSRCHADLAFTSQIISKGFTGRHGRAYLVAPPSGPSVLQSGETLLPNTFSHKAVPRHLVTGMHTVADISCMLCGAVLGWKYVSAEEEAQRYKVGKFILETKRCGVVSCWEKEDGFASGEAQRAEDVELSRPRQTSGEVDGAPYESYGKMPPATGAQLKEEAVEFDSQDEDECEDLFAGIWTAQTAMSRRGRKLGTRSGVA